MSTVVGSLMLWLTVVYSLLLSYTLALSSHEKCSRELENAVYYVDVCAFPVHEAYFRFLEGPITFILD